MATHISGTQLHGVPPIEIELVSEVLNEADFEQQATFGDLINAAIVRNFKAARLKDRPVSVRGLARVIGIQPSTLRRRLDQLVAGGWLERMDDGSIRYSQQGFDFGAPASRAMMHRFAASLQKAGWVDFRPPAD
ncbi:MAG TPA: winged helix-turn-helix domain-containing protein [Devosia sp.]|nr:winged helix-turn-helix domain-containing protein [Devosia sp.]